MKACQQMRNSIFSIETAISQMQWRERKNLADEKRAKIDK
jgi:hypothetical protein